MVRGSVRARQGCLDMRANGDIRQKERFTARSCPIDDLLLLWSLIFIAAFAVPFLAKNVPHASRTDIAWWMTGVVYQAPTPDQQNRQYFTELRTQLSELRRLGITAVRLSEFFPCDGDGSPTDYYKPNPAYGDFTQFEDFVSDLDSMGMKLIVDLPVVYTSTAHMWFWEDRLRKAEDTSYIWSDSPIDDGADRSYFTSLWKMDTQKQQYYLSRHHSQSSALLNYASPHILAKIKHVLEHWIRRGVDGFVFLEYDAIKQMHITSKEEIKQIEIDDPFEKKLNDLINITRSFRKLFDFYNEEYEGTLFFGVDVTCTDDRTWLAVHDAGADLVLNHEVVLSEEELTEADLSPYRIRTNVRKALGRVPEDHHSNWEICRANKDIEISTNKNTQNLLNLVHLMLPGAAFLCPAQLHKLQQEAFHDLVRWRDVPAMSWGTMETTLVDTSIFSFSRFAYGRMFDRYLVIINFGSSPEYRNFTLRTNNLKIENTGLVRYCSCESSAHNPDPGSVIHLNATLVPPRCGMLIQLILKPFI